MKKINKKLLYFFIIILFYSCSQKYPQRTVLAIPVYGQSLALGEEAIRITDFDSLSLKYNNRIVSDRLDGTFGYFSESKFKKWMKRLLNDRHRAFELSVYGMSERIMNYEANKGNDTLMLSIFPGGSGATSITSLGKNNKPYNIFIDEIESAYKKAHKRGWNFNVPAICWMQGEDDIVWRLTDDYKKELNQLHADMNSDIKKITGQKNDVVFICYQTNCLTLADDFNALSFNCIETNTPQSQMELIRDNALFMASGPTYPYSFARERVHIDGLSQKHLGHLVGLSVLRLLNGKQSKGLTPAEIKLSGDTVVINFNIPYPPLVIDTFSIFKASNLGFSVISPNNMNILKKTILQENQIKLICMERPVGCKIRYAVNGEKGKSGYQYGPRGNLRDSQGEYEKATIQNIVYPLHNWCYQFDILLE